MTDPVVRSSALSLSTAASTSLVCTMPAGFVAGDLLLAFYLQRTSTAAATQPSGWTQLASHASGSGRSADSWGKVAAGGETLTITKPSTDAAAVIIFAIQTGTYDTVTWTEGYSTLMAQGSDATPPLPEATSTVNGALAISVAGIRDTLTTGTGLTAPGTWTQRGIGYADNNTNGMCVGGASKTITTAGSTGTYDWSSPVTNSGPMVTVIVRPDGSSGTPPVTAEVYEWDAGANDYQLTSGVRDWRTASSDYLPVASYNEVRYWNTAAGQYLPVTDGLPDTDPPTQPGAITTSNITDTTITFTWGASTDTVGVTGYRIRLNGGAWTTTTATTYPATGLTASTSYTPEVQARDAAGNWSTTRTGSATSTLASPDVIPPTQPTNFTATPSGATVALAWTASTDAVGVVAYDVHRSATTGFTPSASTLRSSPTGTSYSDTLVPTGTWYYKVIARDAAGNSSVASAQRTAVVVAPTSPMLMGCSGSDEDHGGTEVWDGWRMYSRSKLYQLANRTGTQRPQFAAYSEQGANLSGSYATVKAHALEELDAFYYGNAAGTLGTGTAPTQTHSARWGIKLYWSNGNENSDKGDLSGTHTAAAINAFTESQRGLYDAVHTIDSTTGLRRYPDAYAGSNPTQNHELSGIVADWLHPSAQYHDFVMWSFYPPGRNTTDVDPEYNWPSFVESTRTDRKLGFMIRCFYRTFQAQAQARIDTGDPTFALAIGCGEIGIGSNPADNTTRPYYAVHGLAGALYILADQYNMDIPFACWWDNEVGDGHSILSDEPPTSDHGGTGTTSPSTRLAWQNWITYDHRRGGTHPASWSGNPKSSWKQTGNPV